jgi:hypothetical protein
MYKADYRQAIRCHFEKRQPAWVPISKVASMERSGIEEYRSY